MADHSDEKSYFPIVNLFRWLSQRPIYFAVLLLAAIPHVGLALFGAGVVACCIFHKPIARLHQWDHTRKHLG